MLDIALDGAPACDQLLAAGCVPPLLDLLRSSSLAVQTQAAGALAALVGASAAARAACAPAIPGLVALVARGGGGDGCAPLACSALADLCHGSPERCAAVVAAGGHTALLLLAASRDALVHVTAARALANLSWHAGSRAALRDAGAFAGLAAMLRVRP